MTKNQAIQSLERELFAMAQSLDDNHSDAIRARHKLAHAHRAACAFDEALVLFERNVAAGIRTYGPQNLITLRMRSSLANCLANASTSPTVFSPPYPVLWAGPIWIQWPAV